MMFTDWLLAQRQRRDPVGDLAFDLAADYQWPRLFSVRGWRQRLLEQGAGAEMLAALEIAWGEWQAESEQAPEAIPKAQRDSLLPGS